MKKLITIVAMLVAVSTFAGPHGGFHHGGFRPGGGFHGGGFRPAPMMHHHHGSFWGRGGRNFWPGFAGGVVGGLVGSTIVSPTVVTTPVVTTPVVSTPVVTTPTVVTTPYGSGYYPYNPTPTGVVFGNDASILLTSGHVGAAVTTSIIQSQPQPVVVPPPATTVIRY